MWVMENQSGGDGDRKGGRVGSGGGGVFALVIVPPGLIRNAESFLPFALPIVFVLFPSILHFLFAPGSGNTYNLIKHK